MKTGKNCEHGKKNRNVMKRKISGNMKMRKKKYIKIGEEINWEE